MRLIQTQGSLELCQDERGTLFVRFADWAGQGIETLSTARKWHTIDNRKVSGSQAVTIKGWFDAAVAGQFDAGKEGS